jgi:beta-glucosidase
VSIATDRHGQRRDRRRRPRPVPGGLQVGRRHRGVPDRGRGRARTAPTVHLGHLRADAGQRVRGPHGDVAVRPLPPLREDVGLMAQARPGNLPVLGGWPRIKPDGTGPVNPRGLDFYDSSSTSCSGRASTRWSRSTTGTCRRRWRTRAAGRSAARRTPSPTCRRDGGPARETAYAPGPRSTSRGARRSSGTPAGSTRRPAGAPSLLRSGSPPPVGPRSGGAGAAGRRCARGVGDPQPDAVRPVEPGGPARTWPPARLIDGLQNRLLPRSRHPRHVPDDMLPLFERSVRHTRSARATRR